jgi:GNAT superfamily N-acetyltransferase
MITEKPVYRRFPKVPIERRTGAFLIDFIAVWLLCSMVGNPFLQAVVFAVAWLISRVVVVDKYRGQSLGRYALDMKIIDSRYDRVPDLLTLAKREGLIGSAAFLAMLGLNINFSNAFSMLLLVSPLVADCAIALADDQYSQAFHDRLCETYIIQTERGFSLDLRLKKIFLQVKRNLRR